MSRRSIDYWRNGLDPASPEGIEASLKEDEDERKRRDKKIAKRCPICGRVPSIPFEHAGRHIYNGHCEKCDARFVIHING